MNRPIFIYGPPASGKTTIGKALERALGAKFVDNDAAIVEFEGRSIPDIFKTDGEPVFRKIESETLRKVVAGGANIISLGGGTLLDPKNREFCEATGTILCIDTPSDEELERRIGSAAGSRPLGNKAKERAPHYASFPNRINTFFDLGNSVVVIGKSLAPAFLAGEQLVVDSQVAILHRSTLSTQTSTLLHQIPSGEEHKTPATVMALWSAFAKAGLSRRSRVAAVGGGVTGDLTGFAAATWMRGIDWINFPTTLLSMVDASTGGKTGCDLPEGKNLAGAFHSPKLVVIDTDFLKTLPADILADGRAEMIKHEAIERVEVGVGAGVPTPAEIAANLAVKVGVVREDPFETKGLRMKLNCGHTIGHAVEKASDYKLSHGKAVAIGCVEEARLAVKLGLAPAEWPEEFAARFRAAGLPTEYPAGMTFENLKPLMLGDKKKSTDGSVTFALPCGWGNTVLKKVVL